MEVVIDGRGGWGSRGAEETVAGVIRIVRSSIGKRAVVQIVLDGEELSDVRQAELAPRKASDFSLLEVKTVDSAEFARSTLVGVRTHLDNLRKLHGDAAGFIDATEYGRASERLAECYGAWDTLSRAVRDVASVLDVELKALDGAGTRGDECVRRLNQALLRFRGAMEFRDVMRLAEISDRDLRPSLAAWGGLVEALEKLAGAQK